MSGWSDSQLGTLHDVQEIRITPADERSPGRLVWVLETGGRVFVRSWKGPEKAWYRDILACEGAHISGQDIEIEADVTVARASDADAAVDAEFLRKYGDPYATEMTLPLARETTLELLPIEDGARG
ncbi:DUF2255 family protein [Pseudolysinimonas sp.]|uniref:DUF2255 family protein n=1 Tax=Pseudolysinimonas sp. TaxID=2680009 RepID=UPI003F8062BB